MKKGFTLVEMLTVVVILGVIATITISAASNLLEKSKVSSFKVSGEGFIKVAKNAYYEYAGSSFKVDVVKDKLIYVDGVSTGEKLSYDGLTPTIGVVEISADGKISMVLSDGVYCAYKKQNQTDVSSFRLSGSGKPCDLSKL